MKTISVQQFCIHYDVPQSFIESLSNFELIELVELDAHKHIPLKEINHIEKLMRMHYDLQVNFEGLDIINNMINQINSLQTEVRLLKNKLEFYE